MASEPLPGPYPIKLKRGDSRLWTLVFTEDDGTTTIDVSDNTWSAQVRETQASADILLTLDIDDTDAADGVLVMTLDKDEWDNVTIPTTPPTGKWFWDIQGETAAGFVRTYLADKVTILWDVTR